MLCGHAPHIPQPCSAPHAATQALSRHRVPGSTAVPSTQSSTCALPSLPTSLRQGLALVHEDYVPLDLTLPYVPGYLGMREVPVYTALLERVRGTELDPQVTRRHRTPASGDSSSPTGWNLLRAAL